MVLTIALSWWLLFAAVGTAVLDVESTQSCLQRNTCIEGNPLLSNNRWNQYGLKVAIFTPLFIWNYKSSSYVPKWIIVGTASSQGVIGALNLRF